MKWVHEGSWFSTQARSAGLAGSGAGSALCGSVSLAVSAQGVPAVPGLGAFSGREYRPCCEAVPSADGAAEG